MPINRIVEAVGVEPSLREQIVVVAFYSSADSMQDFTSSNLLGGVTENN